MPINMRLFLACGRGEKGLMKREEGWKKEKVKEVEGGSLGGRRAYRAWWRKAPQQRLMSSGKKVTLRRGGEEEQGRNENVTVDSK